VNPSVRAIVLHHTDTSTAYTPEQAFAQVRSLYAFHTKVRGWNDVGYNFIVDRYGRVFEGRRGSITQAVMGAHAGGFNAQTLGIAVLGTFSRSPLPTAVERALVPLVAWKSTEYGVNPAGRTTLTSAGGSYTRYAAGTRVPVYGLIGHRDVDSTECPGDAAYLRLPALRARAAALMVPDLVAPSLAGGPTTVAGRPVAFTATIPTRQRWWLTVTRMCGGTPVRVVSGTSTGRIAASWDLRDAAGHPVPAGPYRVTVISSSPVGAAPPFGADVEVLATPESLAAAPPWGPAGPPPASGSSARWVGSPLVVAPTSRLPQRVVSPTPTPPPTPNSAPTPTRAPASAPTTRPTASPTASPTARPTATPTTGHPGGAPAEDGPVAASNGCPVRRVAGDDPALTSVVAGRLAHPDAREVVLVNGSTAEGLAHGLTAATLAAARSAPLLLTGTTAVPPVVVQDLVARQVTAAWLVGPPAVIAPSVEQQLRSLGVTSVTRLAGPDPWSTAAAVAAAVGAPAGQAVLVSGDRGEAQTALVAAASAAAGGRPVLLTSRSGVPAATLAVLAGLRVSNVTVVGSTSAVPEGTLAALGGQGVTHRVRVTGRDRWTTAVAVADGVGAGGASDRVVLASGEQAGEDLLVASGQARHVLLTASDRLPAPTAGWLQAHSRLEVCLVASPAAVGTAVLRAALTRH
jgi:putative cell wall-binding protein